jgi:hypothetical protein
VDRPARQESPRSGRGTSTPRACWAGPWPMATSRIAAGRNG